MAKNDEPGWVADTYGALKDAGVSLAAYVPDGGFKELIERCHGDSEMDTISLVNEAEGPCLLAGAWLGGTRGVLMIQSNGVGNCGNNFGLTKMGRFPLLAIVSQRGSWGEANSWMMYSGEIAEPILKLGGFHIMKVDDAADVADAVRAGADTAFKATQAVAVVLTQRVLPPKQFVG
jgi:sulfopyruvate decarboxylase TPP-binding subunit